MSQELKVAKAKEKSQSQPQSRTQSEKSTNNLEKTINESSAADVSASEVQESEVSSTLSSTSSNNTSSNQVSPTKTPISSTKPFLTLSAYFPQIDLILPNVPLTSYSKSQFKQLSQPSVNPPQSTSISQSQPQSTQSPVSLNSSDQSNTIHNDTLRVFKSEPFIRNFVNLAGNIVERKHGFQLNDERKVVNGVIEKWIRLKQGL
ncbi:hypothetical protein BKA69DRAFT_1081975 [Paraphysoderma sedebokerense]|nr:hypothetical protein BKA69DRAFT_1081975 [Paraphysoderma sedebokerense]